MDRSWIENRNKCSADYIKGVESFMEVARKYTNSDNRTRCPCRSCYNILLQNLDDVEEHLFVHGFDRSYRRWVYHGENESGDDEVDVSDDETEEVDGMQNILEDLFPTANLPYHGVDATERDNPHLEEVISTTDDVDYTEYEELDKFRRLLGDMQRDLYPGCKKYSKLSFLIKLLHLKVINNWSNKSMDMLLDLLKDAFPEGDTLPKSHYEARKIMRDLGLGYESIPACKNDCILFWKEFEKKEECHICGESRYIEQSKGKKKIPQKVLRYFPLKPRLQRLFMSRKIATNMRWHKEKYISDGNTLRHPADSKNWKDFDQHYKWFAQDPRNVRLGLASDGFNPFGNMSNAYSMWPVVLIPYNLPPWMCMKEAYFMMTLLIPGPRSPGKDIDVYLQTLIDELNGLWEDGVATFDGATNQVFRMHATLLWTINDFPTYGNLSGWSMKGKLACLICNKNTSLYLLKNIKTLCYMRHRRFLLSNHS